MGTRYYEPVSGDLKLWSDPATFVRADLEDELAAIEEIMALSDDARAILAGSEGLLAAYDQRLEDIKERLANLIDFFDYSNTPVTLNVKDGAWYTPVAVQSFCGEDIGQEAILTIDGQTNTYWQHDVDEQHNIVWQLRDYTKRIAKLEVRVGGSGRNLLTGLDVYIANTIDGLASTGNRVIEGGSLVVPNSWEELSWGPSKANGQYIRFADFQSQHANNYVRIQEIRAWVVTVEYDETI